MPQLDLKFVAHFITFLIFTFIFLYFISSILIFSLTTFSYLRVFTFQSFLTSLMLGFLSSNV